MRTSITCLVAMFAVLMPMAFGLGATAGTLTEDTAVTLGPVVLEAYSHYTFSVNCGSDASVDLAVYALTPGWSILIESGENMTYGQVNNILWDDGPGSWTATTDDEGDPLYVNMYDLGGSDNGIFYVTLYSNENRGALVAYWVLSAGTVVSGGAAPGYVYDGRRFPTCDAPSILGPGTYRLIAGVDRGCIPGPLCFGIDEGELTYVEVNSVTPGHPCEGTPYEVDGFRITDKSGTTTYVSAEGPTQLDPGWYQLWPVGGAETVVDITITIGYRDDSISTGN